MYYNDKNLKAKSQLLLITLDTNVLIYKMSIICHFGKYQSNPNSMVPKN